MKKLSKLNTHLSASTNVLNFRCFGCGNRRIPSQELRVSQRHSILNSYYFVCEILSALYIVDFNIFGIKMADTSNHVAADAAPTASPAAKKEKKTSAAAKNPRTKPNHPPTSEMVNNAIKGLKERGGSSLKAIKKYVAANYKVDAEKVAPFIKKYLKSAVASGSLVQTKGKGASGSFKLATSGGKQASESGAAAKKKSPATKKKTTAATAAKKPKATTAKKTASSPAKKATAAKPKKAEKKTTEGGAAAVAPAKKAAPKKKAVAAKAPKSPSKAKKTNKSPTKKPKAPKPKSAKAPAKAKKAASPKRKK